MCGDILLPVGARRFFRGKMDLRVDRPASRINVLYRSPKMCPRIGMRATREDKCEEYVKPTTLHGLAVCSRPWLVIPIFRYPQMSDQ